VHLILGIKTGKGLCFIPILYIIANPLDSD